MRLELREGGEKTGLQAGFFLLGELSCLRYGRGYTSTATTWVRTHIPEDELRVSQLPDIVPKGRRASIKPDSWYARPDHLVRMLQMAAPVLKGRGKIMKWANSPSRHLGDRRPIDLIETDDGATQVFEYIQTYISECLPDGQRSLD